MENPCSLNHIVNVDKKKQICNKAFDTSTKWFQGKGERNRAWYDVEYAGRTLHGKKNAPNAAKKKEGEMHTMIKFAAVVCTALGGMAAALWAELYYLPSDWMWAKMPLTAVFLAGILVALILLCAASTRADPKDLWDSWWFRYMRGVWEENFGGYGRDGIYCVDVCRAFWLSLLTLILWLINVGVWVAFFYVMYRAVTLDFVVHSADPDNVIGTVLSSGMICLLVGLVGIILALMSSFLFTWRYQKYAERACRVLSIGGTCLLTAVFLVLIPLELTSLAQYLLTAGVIVGSFIVAIGAAVALMYFVVWVTLSLVGNTAAGALSKGFIRSFKEKTCVLIYSKPKEKKQD